MTRDQAPGKAGSHRPIVFIETRAALLNEMQDDHAAEGLQMLAIRM